jgi:hypothetical protein
MMPLALPPTKYPSGTRPTWRVMALDDQRTGLRNKVDSFVKVGYGKDGET